MFVRNEHDLNLAAQNFPRVAFNPEILQFAQLCDLPAAKELIEHANVAPDSLLDTIDILFNILDTLDANIPEVHLAVLSEFADHLIFEDTFSQLFDDSMTRTELVDAVDWCVEFLKDNLKVLEPVA